MLVFSEDGCAGKERACKILLDASADPSLALDVDDAPTSQTVHIEMVGSGTVPP